MPIAQVAPLAEAVPPLLYGGTERVVSYLTEALVALGHEVTLFASADSETEGTLVPAAPRALRLAPAGTIRLPPTSTWCRPSSAARRRSTSSTSTSTTSTCRPSRWRACRT